MANSKRKCKQCKEYFLASESIKTPAGTFCSLDHAIKFANESTKKAKERAAKKEKQKQTEFDKVRKKNLMTRGEWYKKLQVVFNQYIRERDKNEPCCTCGTTKTNIQYHAGHFYAVGAGGGDRRRFEQTNVHKQCSTCNNYLSGNVLAYRRFIISKYGQEHYDYLKNINNFPLLKDKFPHWSDIENEITRLRQEIKKLKNQ